MTVCGNARDYHSVPVVSPVPRPPDTPPQRILDRLLPHVTGCTQFSGHRPTSEDDEISFLLLPLNRISDRATRRVWFVASSPPRRSGSRDRAHVVCVGFKDVHAVVDVLADGFGVAYVK